MARRRSSSGRSFLPAPRAPPASGPPRLAAVSPPPASAESTTRHGGRRAPTPRKPLTGGLSGGLSSCGPLFIANRWSASLTHDRGHATGIHIGRQARSRKGFVNRARWALRQRTVATLAAERRSLRQTALFFLAEGLLVRQRRSGLKRRCNIDGREGQERTTMFKVRVHATTLVGCALLLCLAAIAAQAEETVTITEAGFSPDPLGVPTNVFGARKIRLDEPARALADHPLQRDGPGRRDTRPRRHRHVHRGEARKHRS